MTYCINLLKLQYVLIITTTTEGMTTAIKTTTITKKIIETVK